MGRCLVRTEEEFASTEGVCAAVEKATRCEWLAANT
jgi:hypothetical protein